MNKRPVFVNSCLWVGTQLLKITVSEIMKVSQDQTQFLSSYFAQKRSHHKRSNYSILNLFHFHYRRRQNFSFAFTFFLPRRPSTFFMYISRFFIAHSRQINHTFCLSLRNSPNPMNISVNVGLRLYLFQNYMKGPRKINAKNHSFFLHYVALSRNLFITASSL